MKKSLIYVGLDVHKDSTVIAMATGKDRAVVVRTIPNDWPMLLKVLGELGGSQRLRVCYEAGPTGYGMARRPNNSGICCIVVAPSRIPREPGQRAKTDRRDAKKLAELLRAGLLREVKIPEEETAAMRDLERCRDDAKNAERTVRHQLDKDIEELVETWSLASLVRALQALRGVRLLTAVILVAEIGDFLRFMTPRQLMAYLGQVPGEDSSGQRRHRGRITRTGNGHARRILTEAAWNYRFRPRPSRAIRKRRESLPPEIVAIAEKAEQRLSHRYQHLVNKGKSSPKAATAVARELAGFVWAIAREVRSQVA